MTLLAYTLALGAVIGMVFVGLWCVNNLLSLDRPDEQAWRDCQDALWQAERDLANRDRLKQFKE